jgi:alpha-galactosidase
MKLLIVLAGLILSLNLFAQKTQGLALTPPMGWSSWNKFGCEINETIVKEIADAMVTSGMKDAGYEYVNIDDCWQMDRDEDGNIICDSVKFPSGMKVLADYVHSKGLKFGLYSCAGRKTCGGRPGGYSFEEKDAKKYAEWGVDYLKYDNCNTENINSKESYLKMSKALAASGRPIVFSLCDWGDNNPWYWAKDVGHLWRTTGDIQDCWSCTQPWNVYGWTYILDKQEGLEKFAGPGHWNDPDMLEVGNGGMKDYEYQAHFSFWCLLAAPLIAGNDLRNMDQVTKDILLNKDAIAVNQDKLGKQGSKQLDDGNFEVWTKPLSNGDWAVILFNRGFDKGGITIDADVKWKKLGIKGKFKISDIWSKADLGISNGYIGKIPVHSVVFLRLHKI